MLVCSNDPTFILYVLPLNVPRKSSANKPPKHMQYVGLSVSAAGRNEYAGNGSHCFRILVACLPRGSSGVIEICSTCRVVSQRVRLIGKGVAAGSVHVESFHVAIWQIDEFIILRWKLEVPHILE